MAQVVVDSLKAFEILRDRDGLPCSRKTCCVVVGPLMEDVKIGPPHNVSPKGSYIAHGPSLTVWDAYLLQRKGRKFSVKHLVDMENPMSYQEAVVFGDEWGDHVVTPETLEELGYSNLPHAWYRSRSRGKIFRFPIGIDNIHVPMPSWNTVIQGEGLLIWDSIAEECYIVHPKLFLQQWRSDEKSKATSEELLGLIPILEDKTFDSICSNVPAGKLLTMQRNQLREEWLKRREERMKQKENKVAE